MRYKFLTLEDMLNNLHRYINPNKNGLDSWRDKAKNHKKEIIKELLIESKKMYLVEN